MLLEVSIFRVLIGLTRYNVWYCLTLKLVQFQLLTVLSCHVQWSLSHSERRTFQMAGKKNKSIRTQFNEAGYTHTHTHQPLKLWLTTTARWQKRKLMKIVSHHQNTSHHQLSTWRTNRQLSLFPLKEGKRSLESAHQDKNHGLLAKLLLVQLLAKDL